jgi:hypothetical protein
MFYIEAPAPALDRSAPRDYPTVSAAIATIFAPVTQSMYFTWKGIPVRVGYAEHFHALVAPVLVLVGELLATNEGSARCSFDARGLVTDWSLTWSGNRIRIDSVWKNSPGDLTDLLNEHASVELPYDELVWEWKMPLRRVLDAFEEHGVSIDAGDADTLRRLRAAEAAIHKAGFRYRELVEGR